MTGDGRRHGFTRRQALTFADLDEHLSGMVPLRPVWLAS
jgi:hypothetical protein